MTLVGLFFKERAWQVSTLVLNRKVCFFPEGNGGRVELCTSSSAMKPESLRSLPEWT